MITYQQAISEIYGLQEFAIKMGLENITALTEVLSRPQGSYPVIHIAGTNGKGSTSFYIAKILQAHGLKVGLYTSPHLADYRERITVNGLQIDPEYIVEFWQKMKDIVHDRKATFFDVTTALGFSYFHDRKVDVAVIETGLGGRLDSTNIVRAEIVVITPIDFDHEKQLGNTLTQIAAEKAAIIKETPVVFSSIQQTEVFEVLKSHLTSATTFYYLPDISSLSVVQSDLDEVRFSMHDQLHHDDLPDLRSRQIGNFQAENIALGYQVAREYLNSRRVIFKKERFRKALREAFWPGRLQRMQDNPLIIFDVSHNLHGISNTLGFLSQHIDRKELIILLALLNDKNFPAISEVIAQCASRVIITEVDTPRRLPGEELHEVFKKFPVTAVHIKDALDAYEYSKGLLDEKSTLLVMGSHYLIGKIIKSLN